MKIIIIGALLILGITLTGATVYATSLVTEKIVNKVGRSGSVYTFKHNGNRCYVVESRSTLDQHSISCVRFE